MLNPLGICTCLLTQVNVGKPCHSDTRQICA